MLRTRQKEVLGGLLVGLSLAAACRCMGTWLPELLKGIKIPFRNALDPDEMGSSVVVGFGCFGFLRIRIDTPGM